MAEAIKTERVYFTPRAMRTDFDPHVDPVSPSAFVGEHTFRGGAFSLTIPDGFRSDLASIPGALVLRLTTAVSLLGMWMVVNVNSRVDWPEATLLILLMWLQGWIARMVDPRGKHQRAAAFHDLGYRRQLSDDGDPLEREEVDAMFRAIMRRDAVQYLQRQLLYVSVRCGGWWSWWRNKRARQEMEG